MLRRGRPLLDTSQTFTCFGGACTVIVAGDGPAGDAPTAVASARERMLAWHETFTRFRAGELRELNQDPRDRVPVSSIMARFAQAAHDAALATGGLVDATLLEEIEQAGYRQDRLRGSLALPMQLAMAPPRAPAGPHPDERWRAIQVDARTSTVARPPGVKLDGGGLVKGLAADVLDEVLGAHASYVVDCDSDIRAGGTAGHERIIPIASPFDGTVLHELTLSDSAVATSGISKRSWLERGIPSHQLLDPATGRPAYTGVVEVTAQAPSALQAEALAKGALLSGPDAAPGWLVYGGVVVLEDGSHTVVESP